MTQLRDDLAAARAVIAAQPEVARHLYYDPRTGCYCALGALSRVVHGGGDPDQLVSVLPYVAADEGASPGGVRRCADALLALGGEAGLPAGVDPVSRAYQHVTSVNDRDGRDAVLALYDRALEAVGGS